MKKRNFTIVISAFVLAAYVTVIYWNGQKDAKVDWITTMSTTTGTVYAIKTVLVGTQVLGVISKIAGNGRIQMGQYVFVRVDAFHIIFNVIVQKFRMQPSPNDELKLLSWNECKHFSCIKLPFDANFNPIDDLRYE